MRRRRRNGFQPPAGPGAFGGVGLGGALPNYASNPMGRPQGLAMQPKAASGFNAYGSQPGAYGGPAGYSQAASPYVPPSAFAPGPAASAPPMGRPGGGYRPY